MKRLIYIILVGFCLAACTTSKQTDSKEHILVWQLYNFRNQNIHDKLLSIVEDAFDEDSFDALFIEYTQLTTIGTYGQDSTPYHYNLLHKPSTMIIVRKDIKLFQRIALAVV